MPGVERGAGAGVTKRQLEIAGSLALASGVLTVPLVLFELATATAEQRLVSDVLALLQTGLAVYLFVTFRELLHDRFGFFEADGAIGFLIAASVVVFGFSLLRHLPKTPTLETLLGVASTLAAAMLGVGSVVFALRLLRLPQRPRQLRLFAFTNVALGVCLASIVLLPLAIVMSVAADVLMGLIFFEAARRPAGG
jgi:hypothetical protein